MSSNEQLKKILEPGKPRLSSEAIARLDDSVGRALASGERRRWPIPRAALAAAPALILILAALLWFGPGGEQPRYFLLNEEEFLTALESWSDQEEALSVLYSTDFTDYGDTETWNDTDWEAFREDLEAFQLADNGGMQ